MNILVEQWFEHYGAPKEVHSDEAVRIRSDHLNVHVTTGVPYTHTSNPLCERQNRVLHQNLRTLMTQEGTKDFSRPVTLACPNRELSEDFFNWLYPPQAVPWGASCMVLQKPFSRALQESRRGLAGTQAGPG